MHWERCTRRRPVSSIFCRQASGASTRLESSGRRACKSDWEIERMRAASDILERAFADLHAALRPGMSEREIHNVLAAASFTHGAHRLGYTMAVAGVERGLFGDPTERRWQKGEVLFVDGGVVVDGYWADYCRMYTVGAATPAQRNDYARAVRALDAAVALDTAPTAGSLATPSVRRSICRPAAWDSDGSVTASGSTCRSHPPSTRMTPRHWKMARCFAWNRRISARPATTLSRRSTSSATGASAASRRRRRAV